MSETEDGSMIVVVILSSVVAFLVCLIGCLTCCVYRCFYPANQLGPEWFHSKDGDTQYVTSGLKGGGRSIVSLPHGSKQLYQMETVAKGK